MSDAMIIDLFQKREKRTLINTISPIQLLSFDYLFRKYIDKGYEIGDNLLKQLEFYTDDNKFKCHKLRNYPYIVVFFIFNKI